RLAERPPSSALVRRIRHFSSLRHPSLRLSAAEYLLRHELAEPRDELTLVEALDFMLLTPERFLALTERHPLVTKEAEHELLSQFSWLHTAHQSAVYAAGAYRYLRREVARLHPDTLVELRQIGYAPDALWRVEILLAGGHYDADTHAQLTAEIR